jgi:hypothetical protein
MLAQLRNSPITHPLGPTPTVAIPATLSDLLCVETIRGATNQRTWDRAITLLEQQPVAVAVDGTIIHGRTFGSAGETYIQTISRGERKTHDRGFIQFSCDCPVGFQGRVCKHGCAVALVALGYTPDNNGNQTAGGEAGTSAAPATDSLTATIDALDETTVRRLLARACAHHRDVAGWAAAAGDDTRETWTAAAQAAVDDALDGYDWTRRWKQAGDVVAGALERVADLAGEHNSPHGLCAVVAVGITESLTRSGDRYGNLAQTITSAIDRFAHLPDIDDSHRVELADALLCCIIDDFDVDIDDLFPDCAVQLALGDAGAAHIRRRIRELDGAVETLRQTPAPKAAQAASSRNELIAVAARETGRAQALLCWTHDGPGDDDGMEWNEDLYS